MLRRYVAAVLVLFIVINTASCGTAGKAVKDVFAMDTYMTLTAYGDRAEEALECAEDKIMELDRMLSASNPDGDIGRLNIEKSAALSDEAQYIIGYAKNVYDMTDGAYNPLVYPVMKEWGFTDGNYHVPTEEKLSELLEHMDISRLVTDESTGITELQDKNMETDLGGIAKGYTSDKIMDIFRSYNLTGGIVSLGGNVQAYGNRPDGEPWRVAVRHPDGDGQLGVIEIGDKAVITSGGYERYFKEDGKVYHHIIDPSTGYPARAGLASVTIVSSLGILADALSTAVYVMGYDRAVRLWRSTPDSFDMILYTDDGKQYITEGISGAYEPEGNESIINIRR